MSIDDLRLRTKNLAPLAIMALTVLAMVAFGATRLNGVSSAASRIIEQRDRAAVKLARAAREVLTIAHAVEESILNDSESPAGQAAQQDYETASTLAFKLLDETASLLPDKAPAVRAFAERVKTLAEQAKPAYELGQHTPGLDHGSSLKASELIEMASAAKMVQIVNLEAHKVIDDLVNFNNTVEADNAAQAQALWEESKSADWTMAALGLLSALLACGASFWVTLTAIERPLNKLQAQMRGVAGGDLSIHIDGQRRGDEIGEMARAVEVFKTNAEARRAAEAAQTQDRAKSDTDRERGAAELARAADAQASAISALRAGLKKLADGDLLVRLHDGFSSEYSEVRDDFNAAASKLKVAIAAVVATTDAISSGTREIATAADNLSQRTEQQAASLEETAAALEQITSTLKNSAEGATQAAEIVSNADTDAKKGAVVVREAVEAMDAIAASSNKIGQIIGVIDEIAFQTNLLALNAGVEAARAGDSGKGFAVVASEVRALAQRSAEAAKEIKTLVSASGVQVQNGVKLVAESGKALESIISQVSEINRAVSQIAAGAQQQATGLQQINSAISQMDQTTQQNATMVEESTEASRSLSKETDELAKLIEQFRVAELADVKLRRDLRQVAPHAFVKPAAAPARAVKSSADTARPALRTVATKTATAAAADWTEF